VPESKDVHVVGPAAPRSRSGASPSRSPQPSPPGSPAGARNQAVIAYARHCESANCPRPATEASSSARGAFASLRRRTAVAADLGAVSPADTISPTRRTVTESKKLPGAIAGRSAHIADSERCAAGWLVVGRAARFTSSVRPIQVVPDQDDGGVQLVVCGGDQAGVVSFGHGPAPALASAVDADWLEHAAPCGTASLAWWSRPGLVVMRFGGWPGAEGSPLRRSGCERRGS